jgi:hypothetical protein
MFRFRSFIGLALVTGLVSASSALSLVAPGAWAATEAPTNNTFPFGSVGVRYQQVYRSTEFAAAGSSILISAMRFRLDGPTGAAFSDTITWSLRLSTTSAAPDGLSSTFASNIGGDVVTVFSGTQTMSATAVGSPRPFDAVITFSTPFTYTFANGNLLWDVTRTSSNPAHSMDAVNVTGDSVSRVFATSATASTGTADTLGLVTQFEYTAVPEPATMAALGLGIAALLRRRKK